MAGNKDEPGGPWASPPTAGDIAQAQLDKARVFLNARNFDAAIRDAEAVLALDPNGYWGFHALDIIGDAYAAKDEHVTVLKVARDMLAMNPEHVDGYIHLARASLERRDMRTCIDAIERGLEKNPNSIALMLLNSSRYRRVQDHARGIHWAEKAANLAPWHAPVMNVLGMAYSEAGRKDDAERAFQAAREIDPVSSHTICTAAIEAYRANRYGEARELALQALSIDPQDDDARQIAYRSRVYRNILMRPYWTLAALTKRDMLIFAAIFLALLVPLSVLGVGHVLFPALAIYYLGCMFVVLLVEHLDRSSKPAKPPKLKNY
jgi:tetratricopeptide (TPR) repeat protein